ncbi:related to dimethylaniline monooxygenase [Cephalotrichum gorgonifer]|uniref:Related to dimethylaniline monooxygenase n=1 Tax=Cephalotrichum gorgonifer TaxID=2041049 RepID=A0AAE8N6M1_9PEZI|nr:related to dimethylaniline monooxygenase [Cephalotrichum gorgonifer]
MERFDLVIVGAGWHGLTMAKTYLEAHPKSALLVVDYADSVGGTWASERLYPGLKTNNLVGSYELSDFPLSPVKYGIETGQHIPGRVVHAYLRDVCAAYSLDSRLRLRTKVEAAALLESGDWELSLTTLPAPDASGSAPAAEHGKLITSHLVLATGLTSEPFVPNLPGRESFGGPVFHAKEFAARSDELARCRSVVVIGGNKSSWDVCYSAASRPGTTAHMVMRRSGGGPSWVWPARMAGFIPSISAISSTRLFTFLDPNPYGGTARAVRALANRTWLGRKVSGMFWGYLDRKVSGVNRYGAEPETEGLRPWSSTFWMGNSLGIHNYESSWFDLAREGRIKPHAAEVERLSEGAVHLSDGSVIEADAVVCCTGWKVGPNIKFSPADLAGRLGFPGSPGAEESRALEAETRAEVLRAAPVLRTPPIRNLPSVLGEEKLEQATEASSLSASTAAAAAAVSSSAPYRLYRFVIPTDPALIRAKNLAVIGAHITLHTAIVAQAQALWITAFFDGEIPRLEGAGGSEPDFAAIRREAFYHTEYQRVRRPKGTGGTGDRCPDLVFDSIPYVDMLLADLGLRCQRKASWYREVTEPYRLPDFKGLVQEWLSKAR